MEFVNDKLDYVLILAEEGNLTRAAERLYISQPTLTQYINRLEQELGVKLFDRSVHPITVTPAGRVYIENMKKIRDQALTMQSKLLMMQEEKKIFSIGVPVVRSAHILPGLLPRLLEAFPDLSINVDTRVEEYLENDLEEGTLNLAIGALSTTSPRISYECIEELQVLLVMARSLPIAADIKPEEGTLEHPYLIDASKLNGQRFLFPRTGGGQYQAGMRFIRKFGIIPGSEINCNNLNTLYQLAAKGVGLLFTTPQPFTETYPQYSDQLAFCVLQKEPEYQKSYAGYRVEDEDNKIIRYVMDYLENEYMKK